MFDRSIFFTQVSPEPDGTTYVFQGFIQGKDYGQFGLQRLGNVSCLYIFCIILLLFIFNLVIYLYSGKMLSCIIIIINIATTQTVCTLNIYKLIVHSREEMITQVCECYGWEVLQGN